MKLKLWMTEKHACPEAMEWVGERTPVQAWNDCKRGDWMLWCLGRTNIDKRIIVKLACDIALSMLPLSEDPRVAAAIDAAEGWCEGTVTVGECREAAYAAYAAADAARVAAYAACAAEAARVAAYAACAAEAARVAAYAACAADAAYAAADAACAARAARADTLQEIADLVRERVSAEEFERLVES